MKRVVYNCTVVILMAVVLIGGLSAAEVPPSESNAVETRRTGVTLTPEEPPQFVVLRAVENQSLTFIYWRAAIEQAPSGPPVLVNQPCEVTVKQIDVVGRTVSGKTLADEKAWQSTVGSAMVLVPHNSTIDEVYTASLSPETVLVQPKDVLPKEVPVAYPDGTLPANAPTGNTTPGGNAVPQPGAPTPQQIAAAQKAIAPEITKLKLKIAPAPIINPVINQALPGYMFFPVPNDNDDDSKGNRRSLRIIIKKPDGSVETVGHDDDDEKNGVRIFALLRDQMTVLTPADARKYARVHLLLAAARHPQFKFGPINNISVTPTANGGLSVYAEMPFTGGVSPNAPKSTAFTLTANFSQNGKVLGGARGRR